jgi:hypothetical protein
MMLLEGLIDSSDNKESKRRKKRRKAEAPVPRADIIIGASFDLHGRVVRLQPGATAL